MLLFDKKLHLVGTSKWASICKPLVNQTNKENEWERRDKATENYFWKNEHTT